MLFPGSLLFQEVGLRRIEVVFAPL